MGQMKTGGVTRGDDAADHAPQPDDDTKSQAGKKQDAPNTKKRDDAKAVEVDDVNSANDEGAG